MVVVNIYCWMSSCPKSLCYAFNSPSGLVSRNYDYLLCPPTYLFYCQKGVVLHFCAQVYYSQLYIHIINILDVCYP